MNKLISNDTRNNDKDNVDKIIKDSYHCDINDYNHFINHEQMIKCFAIWCYSEAII